MRPIAPALAAGLLLLPATSLHAQDDESPFDANNERRNALERMDTRRVDYSQSLAELVAAADDLEVARPSDPPAHAAFDVALQDAANADHETQVLTMTCRSYRVTNPASEILTAMLIDLDRDGALGGAEGMPLLTFAAADASSNMRCIMDGDLDARCITRVTLGGTATYRAANGATRERPIWVRKERPIDSDGFCGGMTQGTGYVTREVTIELTNAISAFAAEAQAEIAAAAPADAPMTEPSEEATAPENPDG